MAEIEGTTWKAEYGEISERGLFALSYVGSQSTETLLPIGDLPNVLDAFSNAGALAMNAVYYGTGYQTRKVYDGFYVRIELEPRLDTNPPPIMTLMERDLADLIDVLDDLSDLVISGEDPSNWDGDYSYLIDPETGKIRAELVPVEATGIISVVAGTNVTVDNTDPANPIVSATGGGGGGGAVDSVNGATGVVVLDAADVGARPDTWVPAAGDVTGLTAATQATIAGTLAAGAGITLTPSGGGTLITIAATSTVDAESVRDIIGTALVAGTGISVAVNDAGNTITISRTAIDYVDYADLPPGATLTVVGDVARPTARADIIVWWIHTSEPAGMIGSDVWYNEVGA
jgi:hypothetical protein